MLFHGLPLLIAITTPIVIDPEPCGQCCTRPEPSRTGKHDQRYLKADCRPGAIAV
jgi:hypothetical protein